ncbi:hypothetical protein MYX75_09540 [Acidobacteria bacterium AH-259-A15]|nr:hypothetical protein [Acidobacteria bacterium AH-259-A15]
MRIYDIRKQRPVVKEASGPRGRAPSFEGDHFLVSHFDRGNTNRLGGYFNGFAKSPSQSAVTMGKAPDGTPALIFSYRNMLPSFAGFWIHLFDFKKHPAARVFLDASPFTYLTFSIRGETGGEGLLLQIADRAWENKEGSLAVGDVASFLPEGKVERRWQQAWISLRKFPVGLNQKELASLVFLVKRNGQGRVFVKDLAFTKKRGVQIPKPKEAKTPMRFLNKAMWLWETEKIVTSPNEQQRLLTFCKTQGITDLFLQIPYEAKEKKGQWEILWSPLLIRPLICQLHQVGVKVHALDGDPRFALGEWHGRVIATIQSIIQYNRERPPQERFDGIRFDIEPYLLPNFGGVQKEAILKQYLSLLVASQTLARQADLAFGVDIPFWFDERNEFFEPTAEVEGRPVSELIIDIVDNVGIMDYRTQAYGADGVIAQGTQELRYAAKRGKEVFVGLETVELPDETILAFSPACTGSSRILVKAIDGKRLRLYWIPDGQWALLQNDSQLLQGAILLSQTHATSVPSAKLTFAKKSLEDLKEVMQQTASELLYFPSFCGFALHSYESYRPWLKR